MGVNPFPEFTPGHQFKHQPIPRFGGSEKDLVHRLFFKDFPFRDDSFAILFTDHWRIAGIMQTMVQVVADEIEKGTNVGVANALNVGLVALGEHYSCTTCQKVSWG